MDKERIQSYELIATFFGKVQGVFFRSAVKKHADELSLCGYVENLANGSVRLHATGEKKELEKLLEKIRQNPGYGKVDKIDYFFRKSERKYEGFSIHS